MPDLNLGILVSIVTVSAFDFVGCFESLVVSVDRFQLENSKFHG